MAMGFPLSKSIKKTISVVKHVKNGPGCQWSRNLKLCEHLTVLLFINSSASIEDKQKLVYGH